MGYCIEDLLYFFLLANDVLHLPLCLLAISVSSLELSIEIFAHFLKVGLCLLWSCKRSLYIPDINLLLGI